jgi:hypothetical protein
MAHSGHAKEAYDEAYKEAYDEARVQWDRHVLPTVRGAFERAALFLVFSQHTAVNSHIFICT